MRRNLVKILANTSNDSTIGLVELPQLKLSDVEGKDYYSLRKREPIISKQVLLSNLQAGGFQTKLPT